MWYIKQYISMHMNRKLSKTHTALHRRNHTCKNIKFVADIAFMER